MKVVAAITVRMGSSRLPGKAMMPILGKPMIKHMVERIRHARHIDSVTIATTSLENDNILQVSVFTLKCTSRFHRECTG